MEVPTDFRLMNGHIIIKIQRGSTDELVTASGIYLTNVEQDENIGQVVAIPKERTYWSIERTADGTPVRDSEGNEQDRQRTVDVTPGQWVCYGRRNHHIYDSTRRDCVDHMYRIPDHLLPIAWKADTDYQYFIILGDDIWASFKEKPEQRGNVIGVELYPATPPKPINRVNK